MAKNRAATKFSEAVFPFNSRASPRAHKDDMHPKPGLRKKKTCFEAFVTASIYKLLTASYVALWSARIKDNEEVMKCGDASVCYWWIPIPLSS